MTLVFATHNAHKLKEVQALMPASIMLKSLTDIGCHEDIIEDAPTITGNALIKAQYIKSRYGYDCFADDTGLLVDALNGAPGVYSARYAGVHKSATDNMAKLLHELSCHANRQARFVTVIAFAKADKTYTFEGVCEGQITSEQQGDKGFGYDPIFMPDGYNQTFAQMAMEEKAALSHRGKAIAQFVAFIQRAV